MVKSGPIKIIHLAVGLFAVSMGLVTLVMGFNMDHFAAERGGLSSALMVFTIMILFYILIQPICNLVATTKNAI